MCLNTVTKRRGIKDGVGWKVFYRCEGVIVSDMQGNGNEIPTGVWIKEFDYRGWGYEDSKKIASLVEYSFGFHVFKRKKDAVGWRMRNRRKRPIKKVAYRKACAEGLQHMYYPIKHPEDSGERMAGIVVAREIKILEVKC